MSDRMQKRLTVLGLILLLVWVAATPKTTKPTPPGTAPIRGDR